MKPYINILISTLQNKQLILETKNSTMVGQGLIIRLY